MGSDLWSQPGSGVETCSVWHVCFWFIFQNCKRKVYRPQKSQHCIVVSVTLDSCWTLFDLEPCLGARSFNCFVMKIGFYTADYCCYSTSGVIYQLNMKMYQTCNTTYFLCGLLTTAKTQTNVKPHLCITAGQTFFVCVTEFSWKTTWATLLHWLTWFITMNTHCTLF